MNFEHWRHYARGWIMHFFGRENRAFDEFAAAYRLRPDDAEAARHLAFIAARKKQFAVAEKWFIEAVRLEPADADSHFNLGFVREEMGKPQEAIEAFRDAVRLKPRLDRAWFGMGLAHARLGAHAEAATAFDQAAELQPLNGQAFYQLGMARHHANDPDGVKDIVQRLVRFDPKRARQLVHDTDRADLKYLIPDIPF